MIVYIFCWLCCQKYPIYPLSLKFKMWQRNRFENFGIHHVTFFFFFFLSRFWKVPGHEPPEQPNIYKVAVMVLWSHILTAVCFCTYLALSLWCPFHFEDEMKLLVIQEELIKSEKSVIHMKNNNKSMGLSFTRNCKWAVLRNINENETSMSH